MRSDSMKGICYILAAMFIFSCVNALVKDITASYPIWQVIFFRAVFAVFPALFMLIQEDAIVELKTSQWPGMVGLGVIGTAALYLLFEMFKLLPLADASAITFTTILFITALSYPILKERVGLDRWIAIAVGFAGVMMIVRPTLDLSWGTACGLGFAFLDAVLMLMIRVLTRKDKSSVVVFYFTAVTGGISLLFLPFYFVWPTPMDWVLLVALGVGGGLGQLFLTQSYKLAPAVVVAPMIYSTMIWGTLFGYIFYDEIPQEHVLWGACVVIAAGLFIIWRERVPEKTPYLV